ncbi:MAG: UvrD-helicase domain-containing protein [Ktedonobacteraceae bacterium]
MWRLLRGPTTAIFGHEQGLPTDERRKIRYNISDNGYNIFLRGYMDERMKNIAEEAARLVLRRFRAAFPAWSNDQTPLDELVEWLGLQVELFHAASRPEGTYGYVDPDENEHLIWLCRGLSEPMRRFTLAHELGHALLHCNTTTQMDILLGTMPTTIATQDYTFIPSSEDLCREVDVQEGSAGAADQEQFQERLGIGQSYDPRSQRELAANIFAAELLMPIERIRTLYLVEQVPPASLATIFHVSTIALLNRLAELLKQPKETRALQKEDTSKAVPQYSSKAYDTFQQAAIEAPVPALIVAGPGSGKTSTLIGRIAYMVQTLGVSPQQILALTFSRKAAQEMEERLRQAITGPLPKVSTFHAYCADLLRQQGTRVGLRPDFSLIDEAEGYFLLRQQANMMDLRHYQNLHAPAHYFPDMLKAISRAKDELVSPLQYAQLAQTMLHKAHDEEAIQKAEKSVEIAHIYSLYQEALQRRGDTDFGGLLMQAIQLLMEQPDILREQQQQYQHILVDEFQDVNRASGVLLRVLAGEARRVWVVGDANQAIYGFRGASPANITRFAHDFPGAVVLPLSRNYRSRPDLVRIAESFRCMQLELGHEPGKNEPVRLTLSDTYVTIARATDEATELDGLVRDIQDKRTHGYMYKDMIVLCRTRAQVQRISRTLASAGLPVSEHSGILEQEHIKNVVSILLFMTDPGGSGILRLGRQSDHPITQDDIEALLIAAREQKTSPGTLLHSGKLPLTISEQGRHGLLRLSDIWHDLQQNKTIWSLLAQYLFLETTIIRDLLASPDATRLADYDTLLQLARHYDQQRSRGASVDVHTLIVTTPHDEKRVPLDEHIRGFLEYLSLLVLLRQDGVNRQHSDEEDDAEQIDMLRVMTVHASKGLEFPIVYMPGLVQQRFPTTARSSPISAPIGMLDGEIEENKSKTHESGESCLFYVGVTRARDHVVLSYSERYGKKNYKRSLYLDALEAGLPDERITRVVWAHTPGTTTKEQGSHQSIIEHRLGETFINAMKPATLTTSAIEAYLRCPRQYAYSTLYRFSDQEDSYLLFWQATQKTVETLRNQIQGTSDTTPSPEEVHALYTQHWHDLGGHNAPFAPLYERHGHEVLDAVQHDLTTQSHVTWEMRPHYPVEVHGKTVQVTIDRIEFEQQVEVQKQQEVPATSIAPSFKRTRFGKRKEKPTAETRELFYTLAYRQHFPGQTPKLYSHNMSIGETVPITMTTKKEQSLYEEAVQALQAMDRNEYPAQPAEPFRCPTCPFFLICPA